MFVVQNTDLEMRPYIWCLVSYEEPEGMTKATRINVERMLKSNRITVIL